MEKVATFFTLYWCIYFPTCIAYNDLPGFSSVDEVMTGVIVVYTFLMRKKWYINHGPIKEALQFVGILAFFTVYGLIFGRNVSGGVWLDFIQELRPYSVIYCTWILNPQFSEKQKKIMLAVMIMTLGSWIYLHPVNIVEEETGVEAEFPVLGQLAICTGMSWYLLTEQTKKNAFIALALVMTGMLAPKFKFMGEVVCFIAMVFFLKKHLNFKSPKTVAFVIILMAIVLTITWTRFDAYYVSGLYNEQLARPMTYKTGLQILYDYFPFGSGMGSFACNGAWKYYSPLYHEYGLDHIWGLNSGGGFICDAYYPTLAQFGVVGVFFFYIFWKRRLNIMNVIEDMRYYRVVWITFFCLAIEQTADSSWLSGKGMGYCMLLGLCFNADLNNKIEEEDEEDDDEEVDEENEFEDDREDELTAPARRGLIIPGQKFKIRSWRKDYDK